MRWSVSRRSLFPAGRTDRRSGGGCLVLFGLVFGGMGLLFTVVFGRMILAEVATRQWAETPCRVLSCEIVIEPQRDDPFRIEARYTYDFAGRTYESDRYALQEKWSDRYEALALQRRRVTSPEPPVCWVNPAEPAEAVLHRESLASSLFLLIPLLFVAIGAAIAWAGVASLRRRRSRSLAADAPPAAAPRPGPAGGGGGRKTALGVGLFLAVAGAAAGLPLALGPLRSMIASRHWVETPCTVIWSRVLSHDSDDGTTYSVDIFYEYAFAGETHRSNRFRFLTGSSSGRSGKVAIVRNYPEGSRQVCYVNPDRPEQAVLLPGLSAAAFLAAIPLVLLLLGVALVAGSLRSGAAGRPPGRPSAFLPSGPAGGFAAGTAEAGTALVFRPAGTRMMKAGGCLFGALFWNGIVSVFLAEAIEGWQSGAGDWIQTLFLVPFVAIGIAILLGFLYQLLALANPKPTVILPGGPPHPGDTVELAWELSGRASRVSRLTISLWGVESATYRRGTDTATSREVFYDLILMEAVDPVDIRQGRAAFALPDDLMPSLQLPNNEIKYQIRVQGAVPLWPDIADHYDLTLLPRRPDPV